MAAARMLFDLALQKKTDSDGTEDVDMARQRAANQLAVSSTILAQKIVP
jgi:hypothetical protein